ncbi:hypothetical protein TNCV_3372521 [Trichonephila clavipes]|nr:hypothetical protein TNCV_3372521 [Trichonephila clavipes]
MDGRQGSKPNGCRDPKCPSARRFRMVREDTVRMPLVKVQPVPVWRTMKQLAVGVNFLRYCDLLNDWSSRAS